MPRKKKPLFPFEETTKELIITDKVTGEILAETKYQLVDDEHYVANKKQRRVRHGLEYTQVFTSPIISIPADSKLTPIESAVLFTCCTLIQWENQYVCDPKTGDHLSILDLAKYTGWNKDIVRRAVISLEERNLLYREKRTGNVYSIVVPKTVAYKGSIKDLMEEVTKDKKSYKKRLRNIIKDDTK